MKRTVLLLIFGVQLKENLGLGFAVQQKAESLTGLSFILAFENNEKSERKHNIVLFKCVPYGILINYLPAFKLQFS